MDRWTVEDRQVVFEHPWLRILVDRLSRDGETRPYFYVESPVASAVTLAITPDRQVVLTRQYRHPIGKIIFDLPAGRTDPGEDPLKGAIRELEEETGYRAANIIPLGTYTPFPGSFKVTSHLYFATDLTPGEQHLDEGEELEVHLRPFDEVYAEVLAGQHIDASLQIAVLMARGRGLV
jgi:ADP-ribose pyrophosphatase